MISCSKRCGGDCHSATGCAATRRRIGMDDEKQDGDRENECQKEDDGGDQDVGIQAAQRMMNDGVQHVCLKDGFVVLALHFRLQLVQDGVGDFGDPHDGGEGVLLALFSKKKTPPTTRT